MSAAAQDLVRALGWDEQRGTGAMLLFIATEAMLFVSLFFAYFYLGSAQSRWPTDAPPELRMASIMLVLLLVSSGVLEWGRRQAKTGREGAARLTVLATAGIGVIFLVLQALEYRKHLKTLLPTTDAYGSIFYTITGLHGAHLALGVLMLGYVAALPRLRPGPRAPHRPLHDVSLYWHFVDGAWVVIVALLYVLPHLYRAAP